MLAPSHQSDAPSAAMLNHKIELAQWGAFFDNISRHIGEEPAYSTARVFVVRPGDIEGEEEEAWERLLGLTWEPNEDTITVALDGLDHRIENPRVIWSDEPVGGAVRRIIIISADEGRDEIVFRPLEDMETMRK